MIPALIDLLLEILALISLLLVILVLIDLLYSTPTVFLLYFFVCFIALFNLSPLKF